MIGGTSLLGSVGRIFDTVIGTLLTDVLLNGLVPNNVPGYTVIIVLAVAFDFARSRKRST